MKDKIITGISVLAIIIVGVVVGMKLSNSNTSFGSVGPASEYQATTTRSVAGTAMTNLQRLTDTGNDAVSGLLGSVVITGAAAGTMNFYDATTTDVSKRAVGQSTTTILLTNFPVSTAAGTYTLDRRYGVGIIVEIIGTTPTSTITWR